MRFPIALLAFAVQTFAAGPLIVGVRGGVPFVDPTTGISSLTGGLGGVTTSQRYEIGPTVGFRLPLGFSVEGDALFNRQSLNLSPLSGITSGIHSDSWQFPIMLKFTAGRQAIAPVLGVGVAVRHINDFGSIPAFLFNTGTSANTVGLVAGGGLRFQAGPVSITPEVRFTRWGGDYFSQSLMNLLPLSRNEASVLVGITF